MTFDPSKYEVKGQPINRYLVTWPSGNTARYWGITAKNVGQALKNSRIKFKSIRRIWN